MSVSEHFQGTQAITKTEMKLNDVNSNQKMQQITKYDTRKLVTQFGFCLRLRGLAQMK